MMPLNHVLKKCTARYKLRKINPLIKLFAKNKKRTGNSNTHSENIQSRHGNGIWHQTMFHANNKKRQTTADGRNGTAKSRQNLNNWRKINAQILGHLRG